VLLANRDLGRRRPANLSAKPTGVLLPPGVMTIKIGGYVSSCDRAICSFISDLPEFYIDRKKGSQAYVLSRDIRISENGKVLTT
jgi:hypothetical protein